MPSLNIPLPNKLLRRSRSGGAAPAWEALLVPWVPLLLGVGLGLGAALLIAEGLWWVLIPLLAAIPVSLFFLRYPFVAVMLWLLVLPYVVRDSSLTGDVALTILHRAMIPGALLLSTIYGWIGLRQREPVRYGWVDVVMVLFLVLEIVNIFRLTDSPFRSLINFYDRLIVPFCMYWLIRAYRPTAEDFKRLVPVALVTVVAQFTIGVLSWSTSQVLPDYWLGRAGERTVGTLGNPAVFTTTQIFMSFLLLEYALHGRRGWLRALCFLICGLGFFSVVISFSRGSWLGGALVLVGLAFVYPRVALRITFGGVVVLTLLSLTLLGSYREYALERVQDTQTAQGRLLGGATAVGMIQKKPLFGWGFGNYEVYDAQFRTRVAGLAVRDEQSSHNTYLLILSEMGVVGLALYLFPAGYWLMRTISSWRRLPKAPFQSWHFVALLWLVLIDHVAVSNFMEMIHSNLFGTTIWWMVLGLIACVVAPYQPRVATRAVARAAGRRPWLMGAQE